MSAQLAPGYDPRHWTTTDGHRHTSVPAPVPTAWRQTHNDRGQLVYLSGAYSIVRWCGRHGSRTYDVFRDGIELSLARYGRLRDAKDRAVKNARGRDVVNVA